MIRFLFGDLLWKSIGSRAKAAHRTKAAIAYVTRSLPLSFKSRDVLIVDATDGAIASGRTSATVLARFLKTGVQLYSHDGLHAKVVILDSVLFVSSANLSESSITKLLEAGVETDNPNTVSSAVGLVEELIESSVPIDAKFVARIKKIKVVRSIGGGKSQVRAARRDYREPLTWLLGVRDIDDPKNPGELSHIEAGKAKAEQFLSNPKSLTAWIRYGRKDRAREARRGDNIVIIRRDTAKGNPKRVYRHAPVLLVQEEPNCTRVFYEESPNAEKRSLSWAQFKKVAKLVGLPSTISKNATRRLTDKASDDLNHYWEQARAK